MTKWNPLRYVLFILGAAAGGSLFFSQASSWLKLFYQRFFTDAPTYAENPFPVAALGVLGVVLGLALGNLVFQGYIRTFGAWEQMHSGDKVNIFLGILFGVILTVPFMVLFTALGAFTATVISLAMMILIASIAIFVIRQIEDVLPWSKNKGKGRRSAYKVLDTNVIIDGRVYDVVRTGFLDGQLYVPKFVLNELQYIADQGEPLKRQRGRRGLEVLKQLQAKVTLEIGTHDKLAPEGKDGVDGRLVRLARAVGGDLVTNDHNLNRVASLQDVQVLNINDLALALRPTVLPGEPLDVLILKEGSQVGQGVGYLDDGTMIVVEGGRRAIGEEATVVVTQVHQTERGKMIFAELPDEEDEPSSKRRRGQR